MFLFMSTGTYFKLLDLEISGDLEILEMIGVSKELFNKQKNM